VLNQESVSSRMFALAHHAIHMERWLNLDQQTREIDRVGLEQIQRVAAEILRPETFGVSALGTSRSTGIRARDLLAIA